MNTEQKKEAWLHFCVSSVGGFIGCYALINHCDLFASSQTSNFIHIIESILNSEHHLLMYMVIASLTYMSAIVIFTVLNHLTKLNMKILSLTITSISVIIVWSISFVQNDYIAMLPLFFAMPFQWNAFNNDAGYVCSTIFSTNNIRVTVVSFTNYFLNKDKAQLKKGLYFLKTLIGYHIGVIIACISHNFFGLNSIWFAFIPITVSFICHMCLFDSKFFSLNTKKQSKTHCINAN